MKFVTCVLACGSLAGLASADFIGIDDFTGSETVLTLSGIDMTSLGTVADLGGGITIANKGGGSGREGWRGNTSWDTYFGNISGASKGAALADSWGASDLMVSISGGTSRFGLLLSTGLRSIWDIEVYDIHGDLLGTGRAIMPNTNKAVFVGYETAGARIGGFRITDAENGSITIMDDIRFETVPAPGALAALGLGGFLGSRRRR